MSADFDIHEFAKMFDAALASNNPSVQKSLRNFMMVAAIVHAEEQTGEERSMGPLETLFKKVADFEVIVHEMQRNRTVTDDYRKYKDYYYGQPTWMYNPNTSTTSGTTEWKDSLGYSSEDLMDLMKDLKFK